MVGTIQIDQLVAIEFMKRTGVKVGIVAFFSFLCIGCKVSSVRNGLINEMKKVEGVWELRYVKKSGQTLKAESLNACGYNETIRIHLPEEVDSVYFEDPMVGMRIGLTRERICMMDPVTFLYAVQSNACNNLLIASTKNYHDWYEVCEGLLIRYKAIFSKNQLRLKLKKVKPNTGGDVYDEMIFERVEK